MNKHVWYPSVPGFPSSTNVVKFAFRKGMKPLTKTVINPVLFILFLFPPWGPLQGPQSVPGHFIENNYNLQPIKLPLPQTLNLTQTPQVATEYELKNGLDGCLKREHCSKMMLISKVFIWNHLKALLFLISVHSKFQLANSLLFFFQSVYWLTRYAYRYG